MSHASWSMVNLLEYGQGFMPCTWHYLLIPLGGTGLFNPLRSYTWKCTLVYAVSLKNVLTVQFIMHESGHTYGNWKLSFQNIPYVTVLTQQSSPVWMYFNSLNTNFSVNNRYWHAVAFTVMHLECTGYIKSYVVTYILAYNGIFDTT